MSSDRTSRRSTGEITDGHLLLEQVAAGDVHAFSLLYDSFSCATYALCTKNAMNAAAADSAMTETWIFIWANAPALNMRTGSTQSIVLSSAQFFTLQHRTGTCGRS